MFRHIPRRKRETAALVLNAIADENRIWDYGSLSAAMGYSRERIKDTVHDLIGQRLVRPYGYRLTPKGRLVDKNDLLPGEATIIAALEDGSKSYPDIERAVPNDEKAVIERHMVNSLMEKELIVEVPFPLSRLGRDAVKGIGSFEVVDDMRIRMMLLLGAGKRSLGALKTELERSGSDVTRMLGELEKGQLASVVSDARDRIGAVKYYGLTAEGRMFLSRYLAQTDAQKQLAVEETAKRISVPPLRGSDVRRPIIAPETETRKPRGSLGEIKISLLNAIADAHDEADPRWIYAGLSYEYRLMVRAFKEAVAQRLIGEDRITKVSDCDIKRIRDSRIRSIASDILDKIKDKPGVLADFAGQFDMGDLADAVDELRGLKAIKLEKIFLTRTGEALLKTSGPLSHIKAQRIPRVKLRALRIEDKARLEKLAEGFGAPEIDGLSRNEVALKKQAKIILVASDGKSPAETALELKVSGPYASTVIRKFNEKGMVIFDSDYRKRKPKLNAKARELTIGEYDAIEDMANRFDVSRKGAMPSFQFTRLRRAKVIMLSTRGIPGTKIAGMVNWWPTQVYLTIKLFNSLGMKIFDESYGLRKPKHPARPLTENELKSITEMASRFSLSGRPQGSHGELEFSKARHAMIVLLSSGLTSVELIAAKVGMNRPAVHGVINRFNRLGMDIFDNTPERESTHFSRRLKGDERQGLKEIEKWWSKGNGNGLKREIYTEVAAAKAILLSAAGKSERQIIAETGMSQPAVNRAIRRFNKRGMGIFREIPREKDPLRRLLRRPPKVSGNAINIRLMTKDEEMLIKQLASRFDTKRRLQFSFRGFGQLRKAVVVSLASGSMEPKHIATVVDLTDTYVYRIIREFNERGASMFRNVDRLMLEPIFSGRRRSANSETVKTGGQAPSLFIRELTPDEKKTLEGYADALTKQDASLPEFTLWKARRAKAMLLSSEGKAGRSIAREVGLDYPNVRTMILGFNSVGMAIFERWH
jgi:DNA-binding MarR family transcriptional regulator